MMALMEIAITAAVIVGSFENAAAQGKPNIIFVVADDLGWNDVGWHNPQIRTPHLNHYATQGVILNSSYVQYLCSPSRNAFMTGYFPYHTGLQHGVIMAGQPRFVPLKFTMLPKLLKEVGYDTHMVGKWHLGMCNWNYTPTYRGFDSFFGYYNGAEDYYTHMVAGGYDLRNNTRVAKNPGHTHFEYLFTRHAIDVIEKHHAERPLFLYLPFHLCHTPLQVPHKYENLYSHVQNRKRRIYSGMVSMMDEAFGNITQALDRKGLLDNTLIIFTTDNGGPVRAGANNWPLRGAKTTLWEGGTRGAAFVWSRTLLEKTGYVNDGMIHAVDWFPTILHLAHAQPVSGIDGVNQWGMLSRNAPSNREEFVYNIDTIQNRTAIRYRDWKLMTGSPGGKNDWYPLPSNNASTELGIEREGRAPRTWNPQLYNIQNDPEERHDLADSHPQILAQMLDRLHHWMASGVPPQNTQADPRGSPSHWEGVWTPGWC